MGIWNIGTETLAQSRFIISPLTETVAALYSAEGCCQLFGPSTWTQDDQTEYRQRLEAEPTAQMFVAIAVNPRWIPNFLCPPPDPGDRDFQDEVQRVRRIPKSVMLAELSARSTDPIPADLDDRHLPERVADLLEWVWTRTVLPDWPRRRKVFEADIVARTQQIGTSGWAVALSEMRPGMRWLGDGQLQINTSENPPHHLDRAELSLIPSSAQRGWVTWNDSGRRYAATYPCSGMLAHTPVPPGAERLGKLIGHARTQILGQLESPKSTTQLVALTGQSLGAVGDHLKVLLDTNLVFRRRAGRSVLYCRTTLGHELVASEPLRSA